jgi:hypothetical protein
MISCRERIRLALESGSEVTFKHSAAVPPASYSLLVNRYQWSEVTGLPRRIRPLADRRSDALRSDRLRRIRSQVSVTA